MKICNVFHSRDLDGWMSAAIVKKAVKHHVLVDLNTGDEQGKMIGNPDKLYMLGWDYGQPIPDLSEYDKVIMCDVSFPKAFIEDMLTNWKMDIIYIDHHISSLSELESLKLKGLQDTNFAACELTWKYFFPDEPMPEIVRLLGRYDCFGHKTKSFKMFNEGYLEAKQYLKEVNKLKEFEDNKTSTDGYSLVHYANDVAKQTSEEQKVLEFQYGARQCITNYEEAYKYLQYECGSEKQGEWEYVLKKGKAIYQYLCTEAKAIYKKAFPVELWEPRLVNTCLGQMEEGNTVRKFLCVNQERFNPINFGIDYHKDGYDGFACFWYKDGKWNFSLYNDNGEVDCSAIAKQYGGGGHKGAAGFVVNDLKEVI